MKNLFPIIIVTLFFGASVVEFYFKNPVKGSFYIFSALINLTAIFMR
jgi:hypothetical protein